MKNVKFRRSGRRGFSLVEVSVASGLLVALTMLLAEAWSGMARPLLQTAFRCRLNQEADLALAALARDLGGSLSDNAGRLGSKLSSQFVGWTEPAGTQLWLCFDGGTSPNGLPDWAPPDTVISYEVVANSLVRADQTGSGAFVVARYVSDMQLRDLGTELQIAISFQYRDISQTYTLVAKRP
jgi:type II secretory pathway component PulJ